MAHFARREDAPAAILLRVPFADLALDREIIVRLSELPSNVTDYVMQISWSAKGGGPYPMFIGSLTCVPDDATNSHIELEGIYTIPGGIAGEAFDAIVGHRIAVAATRSLLQSFVSIVEAAADSEGSHVLLAGPKTYLPTCE